MLKYPYQKMKNKLKQNIQAAVREINTPDSLVVGENMNTEIYDVTQRAIRLSTLRQNVYNNISPEVTDCLECDLKIKIQVVIHDNIRDSICNSQENSFRVV